MPPWQPEAAKEPIVSHRGQFDHVVDELIQHNRLDEAQFTSLLGKRPGSPEHAAATLDEWVGSEACGSRPGHS
jgi:hypothetical protein